MSSSQKLDDLNLSTDEIKRLTEALKKEEFRNLLAEYAQEISDPENKKRYEEEIKALEAERGKDVTFIHPEEGYVIKTTTEDGNKVFINICKSTVIEKPSMTASSKEGRRGMNWSIPHSFSPPRDDVDKSKNSCKVFDVVFHPDTYRMGETNKQFREMVNNTAFDGIEKQFNCKINRNIIKYPKLKFKGTPTATILRSDSNKPAPGKIDKEIVDKMPCPYDKKESTNKNLITEIEPASALSSDKEDPVVPSYKIVHSYDMDIQDFEQNLNKSSVNIPKALNVIIDLPLLKSSSTLDLNVFEEKIILICEKPAKYHLEIDLPYKVNEEDGTAKFDALKKCLKVTLPVQKYLEPKELKD